MYLVSLSNPSSLFLIMPAVLNLPLLWQYYYHFFERLIKHPIIMTGEEPQPRACYHFNHLVPIHSEMFSVCVMLHFLVENDI